MLEVYIEDKSLDLSADVEITLNFENPICMSDRIPVPYSFGFEIPKTTNNLTILRYTNRIQSNHPALRKMRGAIMYGAWRIALGEFQLEDCGHTIQLNFTAAILPPGIEKPLYKQELGGIDFVNTPDGILSKLNTSALQNEYNTTLHSNATSEGIPDFVACPLYIKGSEFKPVEGLIDPYSNQRNMFINACTHGGYTFGEAVSMGDSLALSKVIPAFKVSWVLQQLLDVDSIADSPFSATNWLTTLEALMLVCSYHPKYQTESSQPIFDINKETFKASIRFADFMPDVIASDFITEILKLACSSLYIKNDKNIITSNESILNAPAKLNWNGRISDGQSVRFEPSQIYELSFRNEADMDVITDRDVITVSLIWDMVSAVRSAPANDEEILPCYYVESTKQYFEAYINTQLSTETNLHWDFKLLSQTVNSPENESETEKSTFDMNINGSVVTPCVVGAIYDNKSYAPVVIGGNLFSYYNYCPIVETTEKRSDELLFGFFGGYAIKTSANDASDAMQYLYQPTLTNSCYKFNGSLLNMMGLWVDEYDGLTAGLHTTYKQWIEKDKRILKADIRLNESELSKLDLRDKISYSGVNFLIKTLSVTLRFDTIDLAEVELIEA